MRTDEAFFLYTQPCVSDRVRKTNRLVWPVRTPCARYTRVSEGVQPPDSAPETTGAGHTPRKLPRFPEQSPASSQFAPLLSHARFHNITGPGADVKRIFVVFGEKTPIFLSGFHKDFSRTAHKAVTKKRRTQKAGGAQAPPLPYLV